MVALAEVDTEVNDDVELARRLDAFGDDLGSCLVGEGGEGSSEGSTDRVEVNAGGKYLVELDDVWGEFEDVGEG